MKAFGRVSCPPHAAYRPFPAVFPVLTALSGCGIKIVSWLIPPDKSDDGTTNDLLPLLPPPWRLAWSFRRQRNSAGSSATRRVRRRTFQVADRSSRCHSPIRSSPITRRRLIIRLPDYPPGLSARRRAARRSVAAAAAAVWSGARPGAARATATAHCCAHQPCAKALVLHPVLHGPAPRGPRGQPADTSPQPGDEVVTEPPQQRIANKSALFSGLDKITGRIISFDVAIGETVQFGALQVTPRACYHAADNRDAKHRRLHRGRGGHAAG